MKCISIDYNCGISPGTMCEVKKKISFMFDLKLDSMSFLSLFFFFELWLKYKLKQKKKKKHAEICNRNAFLFGPK